MYCKDGLIPLNKLQWNLVNSHSKGLKNLFPSIKISNYRELIMRTYNHPKMTIIDFSLSNICFVCIKKTSQGDVSFTNPKHMFFNRLLFK